MKTFLSFNSSLLLNFYRTNKFIKIFFLSKISIYTLHLELKSERVNLSSLYGVLL